MVGFPKVLELDRVSDVCVFADEIVLAGRIPQNYHKKKNTMKVFWAVAKKYEKKKKKKKGKYCCELKFTKDGGATTTMFVPSEGAPRTKIQYVCMDTSTEDVSIIVYFF